MKGDNIMTNDIDMWRDIEHLENITRGGKKNENSIYL